MSDALIQLRTNQLKAMDEFVHSINNEELVEDWLSCGVPDEASEEDYSYIASDEELYKTCVRIFKRIAIEEEAYY